MEKQILHGSTGLCFICLEMLCAGSIICLEMLCAGSIICLEMFRAGSIICQKMLCAGSQKPEIRMFHHKAWQGC